VLQCVVAALKSIVTTKAKRINAAPMAPNTRARHPEHLCCIVLQCVAVCCSMLQRLAVCCSVLQCVAMCCNVLQCVAVCGSVLQCVVAASKSIDTTKVIVAAAAAQMASGWMR